MTERINSHKLYGRIHAPANTLSAWGHVLTALGMCLAIVTGISVFIALAVGLGYLAYLGASIVAALLGV